MISLDHTSSHLLSHISLEWIGTGVKHRTPFLPLSLQACGKFHTRKNVFERALQKSY